MRRLVECVPNFSEGREATKLEAIVAVMREVAGVFVLDQESDPDHNRSVVTLAGEPEAVVEAAVRAVGKAAELIDLTHQTGAHPRIGATDVVPFIPIEAVTLEDCVALARQAAGEIWDRYRIPVYFYEAAAQRTDRKNLENIRRGQFEGLREEVAQNPDRTPDVGERRLHPTAGATVVGARKFLIAYNINLNSPDLSIAKAIAKKIRFSSGGLPCVKAMGVELHSRHLAQVSMNLTDFETTPIHRVFEVVKREAESRDTTIAGSEIIGLIPRRAIEMTAEYFLKIENFSPTLVLENRLEEALQKAQHRRSLAAAVKPVLEAVGEPTAAPGGGSVAALAGALAASLGQMVSGLSRAKKSLAAHSDALAQALGQFETVMRAHRLPKQTPEEIERRRRAAEQALTAAIEVPLEIARLAARVFEQLGQLEAMSSPSMVSDVRVGRLMAATAVRGALENVATNLASISDTAFQKRAREESQSLLSRIAGSPRPASS
jgi:glutamate formiminotransferase / formiminotetrahydrofolate cyclodeaminase